LKFFKLSGGLGNQLFIYSAALAHSTENETVILEGFETPRALRTDRPAIAELELAPGFILTQSRGSFQATRLLDFLNSQRRMNGAPTELGYVGTNSRFFHNNYFQTYKYFSSNLRAKFWIRHALGLPQAIESPQAGTALHVRLGDYVNLRQEFGLLSWKYYAAALNKIGHTEGAEVHVFSDDPEGAKTILSEEIKATFVFREPAKSPVSDLKELATFRNLVISNSSFSYWAGLVGDSNVFAPKKWFRSLRDPSDLHPPSWTLIESSWR